MDVKETKEMLEGVNELGLYVMELLKDGVGFDDAVSFYEKFKNDQVFKDKIFKAYDGWQKIPAEIKDIDMAEAAELSLTQIKFLPKFWKAIKK